MSRPARTVDRRTVMVAATSCLTCCVAEKLGTLEGAIQDADTWVPVWRTQAVNGQMMMGLAIEPICLGHLTVEEQTAVDQGKLVTGNGGQPPIDPEKVAEMLKAMRANGIIP